MSDHIQYHLILQSDVWLRVSLKKDTKIQSSGQRMMNVKLEEFNDVKSHRTLADKQLNAAIRHGRAGIKVYERVWVNNMKNMFMFLT